MKYNFDEIRDRTKAEMDHARPNRCYWHGVTDMDLLNEWKVFCDRGVMYDSSEFMAIAPHRASHQNKSCDNTGKCGRSI